ncbi:MAG: tetratricopeptide repeat protein [Chlorobi bacterium]|nr:tetratricopeptide repeat protein [Chlorobiota bacterium]
MLITNIQSNSRIKIKHVFAFFFLLILNLNSYCNTDSLKVILKNTNNINLYLELIEEYYGQNNISECVHYSDSLINSKTNFTPYQKSELYYYYGLGNHKLANEDTAIEYLQKSIAIKENIYKNDTTDITNNEKLSIAYYILGIITEKYKQSFYNSLIYYKKALKFAEHTNNNRIKLIAYNALGYIQVDIGEISKAIKTLLKGLALAEKSKDTLSIAKMSLAVGYTYYFNEDLENALKYYKNALYFAKKIKAKAGVSISLINIGNIYQDKKEYNEALNNYKKALTIQENFIKDKATIASIYNNYGNIYTEKKQYEQSLKYFNKALELAREIKNNTQIALALSDIGSVHIHLKNYNKALKYISKALKIAVSDGQVQMQKKIYKDFYKLYSNKGDDKQALAYFKKFTELKDSMISIESKEKISEIETKYQLEKKEQLIALQKKVIEQKELIIKRKKHERIIFIGSYALLVIALAVIIFSLVQIKRHRNAILVKNEVLKQQKEELSAQSEKLDYTNKELRRNSKLKELFFANTSHEIRTPVSIISGFAELVLKTKLTGKQKEYITNIKNSSKNLLVIINDILDFSKIEAKKMKVENIDFDLEKLINSFFNNMLIKAKEKNLELKLNKDVNLPHFLPHFVKGDPVRLNQILTNLVANAIKFTNERGKIAINIENQARKENVYFLKFSISDTGIGIPENKLNNIFENYTQADIETTRKYGGTGLGLSIVKKLIDLQNGTISVVSEVNKGSTFTFTIPFGFSSVTEINATDKLLKVKHLNDFDKLSILLVDDNPVNRALTIDTITMENNKISVDEADNGKIAIEKLQKKAYDIILMDLLMPVMDGYETTQFIRNKLKVPVSQIPILGFTANSIHEELETCVEKGLNDCISKPFQPEELFNKIISLIQHKN